MQQIPRTDPPYCKCGCGQRVTGSKNGVWSNWLSGHSSRGVGGYRGGHTDSNGNLVLAAQK